MSVDVRIPTREEQEQFFQTCAIAFSDEMKADDTERDGRMLELERRFAAYDGDQIVGTAADFGLTLSIPGGELPAAGVTMVGVVPSHRRRGVVRQLMRRQLEAAQARGEPLAILWSSEEAIYGRFGYGMATKKAWIDADRGRMVFRSDPGPVGSVRIVSEDEAAQLLPPVYERVRVTIPGMFARSEEWWKTYRLADPEHRRRGGGPRFIAVLEIDGQAEGYALYRVKEAWDEGFAESTLRVQEAIATSPVATRELWRFLFGVDLIGRVESWFLPVDHPLFLLVTEPRRLRVRIQDALWLRILDVESALSARSYAGTGTLAFELHDEFWPENSGVWRLEAAESGARVQREADGQPDLRLAASELGSVYLGGFSFAELREAGLVEELSEGAVERADELFRTPRAPWCAEVF